MSENCQGNVMGKSCQRKLLFLKYNVIVASKHALLTNATKLDVSDVMYQAWFYVATSISHFLA